MYNVRNERMDYTSKLSSDIYLELEEDYGDLKFTEFALKVTEIEESIQHIGLESIMNYLQFSFKSFFRLPDHRFRLKFGIYNLRAGPRVDVPAIIYMIQNERSDPNEKILKKEIYISGWGYYTKIFISIPIEFSKHFSNICSILEIVYESSYEWLKGTLLNNLSELDITCSTALYKFIRVLFTGERKSELAKNVWFGVYEDDGGYYLLDKDSATNIFAKLKDRKFRSDKSPAFHILNLIGVKTPYEKSITKQAIEIEKAEKGRSLDVILPKVAYASDQPYYLKVEEQMVDGEIMTLYPLSGDKKYKFAMCFPTRLKKDILPSIKRNQRIIGEIFYSNVDSVKKYMDLLKKNFRNIDWGIMGEFTGGLITGATKAIFTS